MKNYIIFLGSFFMLFLVIQLLSGLFLTATFKPDLSQALNSVTNVPEEVEFGSFSSISLYIIAMLSAIVAYFVPKLITKFKSNI
ncbi:hypothetical protein [Cytobacillus sp. IB215316]|uniref:hypothetical protein n=1 Tax=Cytobacillus sp. IB215316 TaxID=3097354 RepID=UPI002A17C29C|nr:hypothetical protein [Cytobacillus sp. IB215316]MDX8361293.1 hypothetical protein [Cytobacillus sp. IB215316]